jgi:xanthine dehydrogenase YagS FAD-binding subunit
MKNFTYFRPETAEQAVALLDNSWGTTELLAGGTDLLDLQKQYVAQPDKVVSLTGIGKLKEKFKEQEVDSKKVVSFEIGAGVTLATIAESPTLKKAFPALAEAAGDIGGPQIRNMGTLGGNLCQRNRCWYFRDEHVNCLLKGGEKCFALDGENRYHAAFAKGHPCVIVNPSTLAPVLIALGATAQIMGPTGKTRSVDLAGFFRAPVSSKERETTLASNEIVLSVTIPNSGAVNGSYEVRHKQAYDWPLVQATAAFQYKGGLARQVKVVLGHVAPTPMVAAKAAAALEGKEVTEATAAAAGKAAADGAVPLSQTAYKIKLIEVAVKRAILIAAGQKKYWEA